MLLVFFLDDDQCLVTSTGEEFNMQCIFCPALLDKEEIVNYIRTHTSESDVVASNESAGLFLLTGRRCVSLWHDNDPYGIYFGPDRQWCQFYYRGSKSEQKLRYEQMSRDLPAAYRQAGVRYVLLSEDDAPPALRRQVDEHKSWFRLCYKTPKGEYSLYQIQPAMWQPQSAGPLAAASPAAISQ